MPLQRVFLPQEELCGRIRAMWLRGGQYKAQPRSDQKTREEMPLPSSQHNRSSHRQKPDRESIKRHDLLLAVNIATRPGRTIHAACNRSS